LFLISAQSEEVKPAPPAEEPVPKLEILAAKLPEMIARCEASGNVREAGPAQKGRKPAICRTFSAELKVGQLQTFHVWRLGRWASEF
jgi:hypothetical protein